MATRIKLKRSTVAATVPTTSNLEDGEVALNIADKKLYARNGSNIIEVANQKPNTGEVVTTMLSTDITNGQGNTFYVASVGSDNTTLGNGGANGKHPDTPFLTITKALTTATSGDTILVAPGEYQETFPMTVGDGVTLRGTNLRSTSVKPSSATNANTAFILSGDCHISDLTIKDFFYDSSNDDGYAFEVVSNMNSTQSPYIERCTVNTKGSVTSGSDPYGYAQGDAGRGAKLDGANIASASQHGSVLFNECTFITPNQIGVKVTNGMRVEWLNCFNYFASIGIQGIQGATGKSGSGSTRLKLGGTSGTFSTSEVAYQLENSFQSGVYARSGSTITLTRTGHGLVTGDYIYADHISGGATDGFYQVTLVDANNVTYTSGSGTISSSNVTYKKAVGRGVVASNDGTYVFITGKGTGEFVTTTKPTKVTSRFGDSQLDTAQKKFGTASILLDGTEDNVKVPTDEDFGFGSANWCLEAFIRPGSVTGTQRIFDLRDGSATDTAPTMYLNGTALHFAVGNTSQINGGTLSTGTWYHVAVARSNGTTRLFLDGTELGTYTDGNDYGTTTPVVIGSNYAASPVEAFNGYVDEVRISKGSARFTAGFTPTTSEYGSDLNTVLLLHANGTSGSTTFTDVSGGISDIRSSGGDSATSVITADYSAFGAEVRSVASACVYGQKGVQADGSGVKLILTSHNFGYVGSGADFTNDPSLAIQNNEVEELNSGKVLFSSTDQNGDFRVGDAFTVDVSTGNVSFQATSTAQSAANITLSDSTGTTNIFPAYIETGNLRFAGNSMTSTTGQVIVDPSGEEDFVVNAETIVKEAVYFDVNKSISFGSNVQGALKIAGFGGSTVFGSSEAANFSTRSFVVLKNGLGTVNLTGEGSGYTGGAQPVEVTTNPFQIATATATLGSTGALKEFTLTNRGNLYTIAPTVTLSGGGVVSDGDATATLGQAGVLQNITIQTGGTGYSTISATVSAPQQNQFTGDATYTDAANVSQPVVDTTADTIYVPNHSFETGMEMTFDATTLDATAVAPTGLTTATTYYAIRVDKDLIKVATSLSNANAGTAQALSGTPSGQQFFQGRTATVTFTHTGGVIDAYTITDAGSGYQNAPTITITGGNNDAAVAADLSFSVDTIVVGSGGEYASNPTVTLTNAAGDTTGQNAAASATIGFAVASISLDTQGLGYRNIPSLVPSGGSATTDAQFTAVLNEQEGRIASITIADGGSGYTSTPTLTFSGGGGIGGTLQADIQSVDGNITSSGSGYTAGTYNNVAFTGGSPTIVATADFTVPGFSGTITNAGSGYTSGSYTVTFRNTPTATYTVTVAQRDKLSISGITGTFAVGNTVTGSVSGASATVTFVASDQSFLYVTAGSSFQDAQTDTISNGSGASAVLDTLGGGINRYLIDLGSGAQEAPSFTFLDNNTYRFDTTDTSNLNHPLEITSVVGITTRQYRTPGTAGSYFEVVVGSASSNSTSTTYTCTVHGIGMSEDSVITIAAGALGDAGDQMTATAVVTGGAVTSITILTQGTNYALGDVLLIDEDDLGINSGGSGFQYTLNANNTGISTVSNISLNGTGYAVNDVLSVDDATVGGGGGSGFQFTVTKVGFCSAVTVTSPGTAFEASDTLILGDVGGAGVAQGTGLTVTIATIVSEKNLEMTQQGIMTLGPAGSSQLILNPDGSIAATSYNIASSGQASFNGGVSTSTGTFTGVLTASSTSAFTGLATFNGGLTTVGATTLVQTTAKFADGLAATPSISFDNSATTGLFRQAADVIGVSIAGTDKFRFDTNTFDTPKLQVDSTLGSTTPFFKVDPTTLNVLIGGATNQLSLDNSNTIKSVGTNIDIPLNFETKGGGDFVFKGGTDKTFSITDGTSDVVTVDTATGTALFGGNLDAGKLRIRQNVVQNNSSTATRAFGEITALTVTGTGSGYTDGTYTATATTSNNSGTGCTVTLTVASGTFSAVTIVAKGQNYRVGDLLTITAAGGGTGLSVTVSDIDGQGVVLKPVQGSSVLVDSTGSLIIPSGTTNERPNTLDRITGAIRFNSSQLQFEGFNGNDFVSLGGVRDVDQDTYILTESAPSADEDTFEFYAAGINNISLNNTTLTFRPNMTTTKYDASHLATIDGGYTLNGTTFGTNPFQVSNLGSSVFSVRSKNDIEVNGGLRFRNVPSQGVASSIDAATITQTATAYTASTTFTAVGTTAQIEGAGLTVNVTTNGAGTITTIAINAGGTGYESGETIQIAGTALGGLSPDNNVTFKLDGITGGSTAIARLDVLQQEYITRMDSKPFINIDAIGAETGWKINRGWNAGTESYLTVFDSTATFMELDDCRVEGGELTSFPTSATITAFDKSQFKGSKTLVTIESDDNKVHMLEVTVVCASNGTTAHATVTNSITSDNDLMDATVAVVGTNVNISLAKSSAATSSSNFTGRFTTTKVKV
ncbi:baseplate wedge initiator [Prochlorococcus phage P-HM2]|uniref:Baseplate wedge initiator n=1 Tax=Prochlorococcus phage P-HM2 TaxID=445696 RepID=E3SSU4_9CAUD|nr:baseplate wedge subunit [Prochlorococcus phage P-HM2]ADO99872.1 baseplate wedge initiator [Prochlorococcus phage P-HM2]